MDYDLYMHVIKVVQAAILATIINGSGFIHSIKQGKKLKGFCILKYYSYYIKTIITIFVLYLQFCDLRIAN
jgi:hypothetical protein